MSGPNSDQPVKMKPHEVERELTVYRAHRRQIDGTCSCHEPGCDLGFVSRGRLWAAGINPEWPPR